MKAVTWHGQHDVRVEDVPDPVIQEPTDAVIRVTTTNICGSDLHLYEPLAPFMGVGRHPRPRDHGAGRRGRARRRRRPEGGRPGVDPLPDLLRALLDVRPAAVHAVRDHAGARARHGRGAVRLLQALRRGARRAGGVPAGAAGPVHPHQAARGAAGRPVRLPLRHPAHRLAGRGVRERPRRRHARRARARPDRRLRLPDRPAQGLPGDRRRPGARAAGAGARPAASRWSTSASTRTTSATRSAT